MLACSVQLRPIAMSFVFRYSFINQKSDKFKQDFHLMTSLYQKLREHQSRYSPSGGGHEYLPNVIAVHSNISWVMSLITTSQTLKVKLEEKMKGHHLVTINNCTKCHTNVYNLVFLTQFMFAGSKPATYAWRRLIGFGLNCEMCANLATFEQSELQGIGRSW